jgi:hypothetical protein
MINEEIVCSQYPSQFLSLTNPTTELQREYCDKVRVSKEAPAFKAQR